MTPKMLEALREMFGPQEPTPKAEVFDIPTRWCRESLNGLRDALAVLTSSVLVGSEGAADCADCHAKTLEWLNIEASRCHDEAGLPPFTLMDWPDVKREFVTLLEAALEAVKTGDQVVKPVPRSAEAIKLFGLDKPKPEADFLKPQMADARAFIKAPHGGYPARTDDGIPGHFDMKTGEFIPDAEAATYNTKSTHGGYPSMGQIVADGPTNHAGAQGDSGAQGYQG